MPLYERASRAYAAGRFADAAEYARSGLGARSSPSLRAELLCLRGESLLRAGQPHLSAEAFEAVLAEPEPNPYLAQALFGATQAHAAAGETEPARVARERLLRDFATSPWAARALREPSP
jgi:outer membrane protein assembly factor BamD (BamD/ComL family)